MHRGPHEIARVGDLQHQKTDAASRVAAAEQAAGTCWHAAIAKPGLHTQSVTEASVQGAAVGLFRGMCTCQGSAARGAVVHVGAEVDEVVGHARAQAQVAHAVVAARVLPLLVAHPQHLPTPDPSHISTV